MTVIFKLVGVNSDLKNEITWEYNEKKIVVNDIYRYFEGLGFKSDIIQIKFITNSENMKPDKVYEFEDKITIFVFTMDKNLRLDLIEIFNKNGYITEKQSTIHNSTNNNAANPELEKPLPEDEIKISSEIISKSNLETIKLFSDNDFQSLIKIYYKNPDAFKIFASYISSGTVLQSSLPEIQDDQSYESELEEIKKLDLSISDEDIISSLKKHNGHINLTLRYLLVRNSIISN